MTSVYVPGHGVMLEPEVCSYYWELALKDLAARGLEGGRAGGELRAAQDALRAARLDVMDARPMSPVGHLSRTSADMAAESKPRGFLSTAVMADQLGVGVRHARRLARDAGVEPAARDAWHSTDVDQLVAQRRTR